MIHVVKTKFCVQKSTVAVWTQKQFIPLLTHPQGSQGCQKMHQDPLNSNLEVWCANMDPKLKKLQKTVKIETKLSKIMQFRVHISAPNLQNLNLVDPGAFFDTPAHWTY